MYISTYANTVVTSQPAPQSYFIKEIENGRLCMFVQPDENIRERESLRELESTDVNPRLRLGFTARINFQILPNSLSCPHQAI